MGSAARRTAHALSTTGSCAGPTIRFDVAALMAVPRR